MRLPLFRETLEEIEMYRSFWLVLALVLLQQNR
jgi:hypothetical protein